MADRSILLKLIIKDYDDSILLSDKKIQISSDEIKDIKASNSKGEVTFEIKSKEAAKCFYIKLLDDSDYEASHFHLGKCYVPDNEEEDSAKQNLQKFFMPRSYENHPIIVYFKKKKKNPIIIGILKAYKKNIFNNFISDTTGISNPSNEIYTIDIEQEIQLRAFIYEEQHSYAEANTLQKGNITKSIKTISQSESSEIKWAFKIDESVRTTNNDIDDKEEFKISDNKPLASKPKGHVEILDRRGDTINIKLSDIFDSSLLDANNKDNIINKSIIFFAYTSDVGIIKAKDNNGVTTNMIKDVKRTIAINNAYTQYKIKVDGDKWGERSIVKDLVSSVELKILKNRFELEFDGRKLILLENRRKIKECEARSGKKIEHTQTQTIMQNGMQKIIKTEKESKDRAKVAYNQTHSFYYDTDIQADKSNDNRPLQENNQGETYYVKIPKSCLNMMINLNTLNHNSRELKTQISQINWSQFSMMVNLNTLDIYTDKELTNKIAKIDCGTIWPFNDSLNINVRFSDIISIIEEIVKRTPKDKLESNSDYIIPLVVKYQKRILIHIERYKQTTESTTSRMNIFIDGKRINKDGSSTEETLSSALNETEPYAYILERPGPDCITPQVKLRIPNGRYDVVWHNHTTKPKEKESEEKFNENTLKLRNDFVKVERAILIHKGNSPKNSDGCLLINRNKIYVDNKEVDNVLVTSRKRDLNTILFGDDIGNKLEEIKEKVKSIEINIINNFT